jgi:hypothetical protein
MELRIATYGSVHSAPFTYIENGRAKLVNTMYTVLEIADPNSFQSFATIFIRPRNCETEQQYCHERMPGFCRCRGLYADHEFTIPIIYDHEDMPHYASPHYEISGFITTMAEREVSVLQLLANTTPRRMIYNLAAKRLEIVWLKQATQREVCDKTTIEMAYAQITRDCEWILTDDVFDDTRVDDLSAKTKLSVRLIFQAAEHAYDTLYEMVLDHEHPNGMLK